MTEQKSGANATGYRVLARKYRPRVFPDLIGQEAMVRTLANAFVSGRIAQAYMLTGVRGVGKTTTARLIARAINYPSGPTADLAEMTPQCEAILESRHMDVIEMDGASQRKIDDIRNVIDQVRYAPASLRYKVYIIDEVHMLTEQAFNALLKTLEEPPPHVKFIFATTEVSKVPITVLSRCQRFDLKRLDAGLLASHYARIAELEKVEAEPEALALIARAAEGSVRDGLSLLDQAIAFGEGKVRAADVAAMMGLMDRARIIDLFAAVMAGDAARAIAEIEEQYASGGDPHAILADLASYTHWVTRLKLVKDQALADPSRTEVEKSRGVEHAATLGMAHLSRAWSMMLKGLKEVELHPDPLMAAEMVLIRLAHAAGLPSGEELARIVRDGAASPAGERVVPLTPAPVRPAPGRGSEAGAAATAAAPVTAAARPAPPGDTRAFSSFRDVLALAGEKRDIKLKTELERLVRPIRVSPGQIELALEPGAPAGLANEIGRKLEAWTGRRWMVLVASSGGEKPVAVQARESRDSLFRSAGADPDVAAAMRRFPGAAIIDVREPLAGLNSVASEGDEESR